MNKKYIFIGIAVVIVIFLFLVLAPKKPKIEPPIESPESPTDQQTSPVSEEAPKKEFGEWKNPQNVDILGYDESAQEPFISKNGTLLFFNDIQAIGEKDLHWAIKIDDTTFQYMGEVGNVNTLTVDANPTMDTQNNFYFISSRNFISGGSGTIFTGKFQDGTVNNLRKVEGTIEVVESGWINMGVEITGDGNTMYTSNALFDPTVQGPLEGNIRIAVKQGDEFNIHENEAEILKNINTDDAIEYAGEVSDNGLELFYSQVTRSGNEFEFRLYQAARSSINLLALQS